MGTFDLVYRVLKASNINNFDLIKDRHFYQLTDYKSEPIEEGVELPGPNDLDELVLMFQNYYIEEYDGKRNKSPDYIIPTIKKHIENDTLYIIRVDKVIRAFCSIINPDIGIIFTKKEYRGQSLGKQLMEYCSGILFEENEIAFVMTDMHNIASNKICQKIGYELIYEHTNLKI